MVLSIYFEESFKKGSRVFPKTDQRVRGLLFHLELDSKSFNADQKYSYKDMHYKIHVSILKSY